MSAMVRRLSERRAASGQLLRLIGRGGAARVSATLVVHLVSGAMPVVFLVGIGTALAAVVGGGTARPALITALGAFAVQQLLVSVQLMLAQAVARRVDAYCSARLVRHALVDVPPRALELSEIADGLQEASDSLAQQRLTPGMAAEAALALVARYTQLVGAAAVLVWSTNVSTAAVAVLVALVGRFGQTEAFHRWGKVIGGLGHLRRRTNYVRDLGTGTRAAKEIRTLGLVDWLEQRYRAESDGMLRPLWSTRRRIYGGPFVSYAALGLVGAVTALVLVARGAGAHDVARLAMAVQAVVLCVRFGVIFPEADVKLVYGRSAWRAMLRSEEAARSVDAPRTGTRPAPEVTSEIRLAGLTFGYQPDQPVLDGLDLTLPAGRSVAVVGVNGAGKSTLIKLLSGLYQPQSGAVLLDGTDLRDLDLASCQARMAITFQDFVRYQLTLRENVAINAVAHRDDDEGLLDCLRRAGLGELVNGSGITLETPLSRLLPGGTDLSGGQWQRVALARALFAVRHGARILVLDEPTAQLDARAEAAFYENFLSLTAGVTSVIISHRFSTVRRADLIVVLDGGRITEQGSHDELLARGGHYADMFRAQARRFAVNAGGDR